MPDQVSSLTEFNVTIPSERQKSPEILCDGFSTPIMCAASVTSGSKLSQSQHECQHCTV